MNNRLYQNLALFDVCGTLVSSNTTYDFIAYYQDQQADHVFRHRLLQRLVRSRRSPAFYAVAFAERVSGQALTRKVLLRSLKHHLETEVARVAADYAEFVLARHAQAEILERLIAHQQAGDRVILVSSSIAPVIAAIAARLSVEYCASSLECRNGRLTGRLQSDITGRKTLVVKDELANYADRSYAYSDNLSDRALLAMVDHPTVVLKSAGRRDRWGNFTAEYVIPK